MHAQSTKEKRTDAGFNKRTPMHLQTDMRADGLDARRGGDRQRNRKRQTGDTDGGDRRNMLVETEKLRVWKETRTEAGERHG